MVRQLDSAERERLLEPALVRPDVEQLACIRQCICPIEQAVDRPRGARGDAGSRNPTTSWVPRDHRSVTCPVTRSQRGAAAAPAPWPGLQREQTSPCPSPPHGAGPAPHAVRPAPRPRASGGPDARGVRAAHSGQQARSTRPSTTGAPRSRSSAAYRPGHGTEATRCVRRTPRTGRRTGLPADWADVHAFGRAAGLRPGVQPGHGERGQDRAQPGSRTPPPSPDAAGHRLRRAAPEPAGGRRRAAARPRSGRRPPRRAAGTGPPARPRRPRGPPVPKPAAGGVPGG